MPERHGGNRRAGARTGQCVAGPARARVRAPVRVPVRHGPV